MKQRIYQSESMIAERVKGQLVLVFALGFILKVLFMVFEISTVHASTVLEVIK